MRVPAKVETSVAPIKGSVSKVRAYGVELAIAMSKQVTHKRHGRHTRQQSCLTLSPASFWRRMSWDCISSRSTLRPPCQPSYEHCNPSRHRPARRVDSRGVPLVPRGVSARV